MKHPTQNTVTECCDPTGCLPASAPPPPTSTPDTAGKSVPVAADARRQAKAVRDAVVPALMRVAMSPKGAISSETVRGFRDELLREMGDPTDPLERMLIEQAATAHVMVLHLHASTSLATTLEGTAINTAAAARLMAELRRTILAIREYRSPPAKAPVTRIEQQNIAERQDVTFVTTSGDGSVSMAARDKTASDSKLASNKQEERHDHPEDQIARPGSRWASEPAASGSALG